MKFLWFFTIALVISLLSINPLFGQQESQNVVGLYFQSVAFPEEFDTSFELLEASGESKNEILTCLVSLRDTYFPIAQVAIQQCDAAHGGNPDAHWECINNDQNAPMAYWAVGMIRVINEEQSWTGTYTGRNMSMAKALSESIAPGSWVEGIKMAMPMIQQQITCP